MASVEVRDVTTGLWLWRRPHPAWSPRASWDPPVTSTCVESRGEVLVLDALAPLDDARAVWERLDAKPPTVAVVLKPDHVRDVDLFVRRYGCRAFGPWLFFRGDAPETELEYLEPGVELPGGLLALYDGRYRMETPLYLPEQRSLVFADALTERDGQLLVWGSRGHEERVLPALRKMLEFPFEHVIISHGDPVHTRSDFEAALEREPYVE